MVDRGEPDIGHSVELAQLFHNQPPDLLRGDLGLPRVAQLVFHSDD